MPWSEISSSSGPAMRRILLVDPGGRVLRAMHPSLSAAAQQLGGMGGEPRLGGEAHPFRSARAPPAPIPLPEPGPGMAVLGRFSAVVGLPGPRLSGPGGLWLLWATAHRAFMPNTANCLSLTLKWMVAGFTRRQASLLFSGMPSQHLGLDAPDAPFPMVSGQGSSIAAPPTALEAVMTAYASQHAGQSSA